MKLSVLAFLFTVLVALVSLDASCMLLNDRRMENTPTAAGAPDLAACQQVMNDYLVRENLTALFDARVEVSRADAPDGARLVFTYFPENSKTRFFTVDCARGSVINGLPPGAAVVEGASKLDEPLRLRLQNASPDEQINVIIHLNPYTAENMEAIKTAGGEILQENPQLDFVVVLAAPPVIQTLATDPNILSINLNPVASPSD